jgi:hypothetical protein
MRRILCAAVVMSVLSGSALAGMSEGVAAVTVGDYPKAIAEFQPLAASGDPVAQYHLAKVYLAGHGPADGVPQGIALMTQAASSNYPEAQAQLGLMYAMGLGVAADNAQAYDWLSKAVTALPDGTRRTVAEANRDAVLKRMNASQQAAIAAAAKPSAPAVPAKPAQEAASKPVTTSKTLTESAPSKAATSATKPAATNVAAATTKPAKTGSAATVAKTANSTAATTKPAKTDSAATVAKTANSTAAATKPAKTDSAAKTAKATNGVAATTKPATTSNAALTAKPAATETPAKTAAKTTDKPADKSKTQATQVASAEAAAPAKADPKAKPTGVRIQLVSMPSETAAWDSWRRLSAKYSAALTGLTAMVEPADLGTKGTFYRVQTGPFATVAAAHERCTAMKAAGLDCLVVGKP